MTAHLVFNRATNRLKLFDAVGHLMFACDARNDSIGAGFGHFGMCPDGEYRIGEWTPLDPPEVPYGAGYITIEDPNGLWLADDRGGIYLHGGGTGAPNGSFALRQGWVPTEGCFRLQNVDLAALARLPIAGIRFTVA